MACSGRDLTREVLLATVTTGTRLKNKRIPEKEIIDKLRVHGPIERHAPGSRRKDLVVNVLPDMDVPSAAMPPRLG